MDNDWQPTEDRVVVRPTDAPDMTKGGIIVPSAAKERPLRGEVVAVGPGRTLENGQKVEIPFGVGDEICFGAYSGMEHRFGIDDVQHLVMRASEVTLWRKKVP